MDINIFKEPIKSKNILEMGKIKFTNANLMDKITYEQTVNATKDLTIGSCTCSTIEFQMENFNMLINQMAGQEIKWRYGAFIDFQSYNKFIVKTKSNKVCINGNVGYVVNKRAPYLSIWNVETISKVSDVVIADISGIESFIYTNGTLYCGVKNEPFLRAFKASDFTLTPIKDPVLTDIELAQVQYYNKFNKSINLTNNILKEYTVNMYNEKPVDLIEEKYEFIDMGVFIAEKPVKVNDTRIKVKCYDRMKLFDVIIDDWLKTVKYPISVKSLLLGLCSYIGVELKTATFTNDDFSVMNNFEAKNLNGRQYLQWIVELAAKFAYIDRNGKLVLDFYKVNPDAYVLDETILSKIEIEDYAVKKIDKVQVNVEDTDIGVIVGTGTNAIVITNNPLLFTQSDEEIRPAATNIYNAIKDITYYPYKATIYPNPLLNAGDIVKIKTRKGQSIDAVIMSIKWVDGYYKIEATGNFEREVNTNIHQDLIVLRGRSNKLKRTVDATINELYDAETGDITTLKLTAADFEVRITNNKENIDVNDGAVNEKIAALSLTLDRFKVTVGETYTTKEDTKKDTEIVNEKIATLTLSVDQFKVTVKDTYTTIKDAKKTTEELKASITANVESIKLAVSRITQSESDIDSNKTEIGQLSLTVDAFKVFVSKEYTTVKDTDKVKTELEGSITATEKSILLSVSEKYTTITDAGLVKKELETSIKSTADSILLSVSDKYTTKTDTGLVKKELETSIKSTSDNILLSVSDKYTTKDATNEVKKELKSSIDQNANEIKSTVEATTKNTADIGTNKGAIGTNTSNISTLTQTANSFEIRITDNEDNISTVTQTINSLNAKLYDKDKGDIVLINLTTKALSASISDANGNISSIKMVTDKITLAVNNSKLQFSEKGLSIYNGGFEIYNGDNRICYIDTTGNLIMAGYYSGKGIRVDDTGTTLIGGSFRITDVNGTSMFTVSSGGDISCMGINISNLFTVEKNWNASWVRIGNPNGGHYWFNNRNNYEHAFTGNVDVSGTLRSEEFIFDGTIVRWIQVEGQYNQYMCLGN